MPDPDSPTTDDAFLGGKLILRQPRSGHRAGHDALLLAAATRASAGQRVMDLGAGVGAAGLALARRAPGLELTLIEIDAGLAALAERNAAENGIAARIITGDVTDRAAIRAAGCADGSADRVLMNPPFHLDLRHRPSPEPARRVAHQATRETLPEWVGSAHRLLRPRGELTLIWRADDLAELLRVADEKFGSLALQPVYAARGKPAVRILLRGIKNGRAPLALHAPIWLDGSDQMAEEALRGRGALELGLLT